MFGKDKKKLAMLVLEKAKKAMKPKEDLSSEEDVSSDEALESATEDMLSAIESKDAKAFAEALKDFLDICE